MRKLLIMISILLACSCGSAKQVHTSTDMRDSTVVIQRDTTYLRDTVLQIILPAGADKNVIPADDSSHLETSVAVSDAFIIDGQLHHDLRNKPVSLPVPVKVPVYAQSLEKDHYLIRKEIETVEVPRAFTHWQSFLMMLGRITLAIAILAGIFKIVKIWRQKKRLF